MKCFFSSVGYRLINGPLAILALIDGMEFIQWLFIGMLAVAATQIFIPCKTVKLLSHKGVTGYERIRKQKHC